MRLRGALELIAAVALAAMLSSCGGERVTYELSGSSMGTSYSIQLVDPPDSIDMSVLERAVSDLLLDIEQSMSTYMPDSELSRFNQLTSTDWFEVSARLCRVIEDAKSISQQTSGAFDVTVGTLVNAWGFGPGPAVDEPPAAKLIADLQATRDIDALHADCSKPAIRKQQVTLRIDLSGYAKGLAVDAIAVLLNAEGAADFLVEIGGEMRASGANAEGTDWAIAIESPLRGERQVARVVSLADAAMATSGDYRNYFEAAGSFYSHTIDPRTGYPITHDGAAVTVIADTAAFADAMATALLVLGPEDGFALAEKEQVAALFQVRIAESIDFRESSRFAREVATR